MLIQETTNMKKKSYLLLIFIPFFFGALFFFGSGWWGYEKWKYRRTTFGNRSESLSRGVFICDASYKSNITLENFNVYIEKGFKYGYLGENNTRILLNDSFPYQLTFPLETKNLHFYVLDSARYKTEIRRFIYLPHEHFKDTITLGINRYTNKWDSIGYVKVWDPKF